MFSLPIRIYAANHFNMCYLGFNKNCWPLITGKNEPTTAGFYWK
jgi:hypothetical protein